jgi:hypothetical protein
LKDAGRKTFTYDLITGGIAADVVWKMPEDP